MIFQTNKGGHMKKTILIISLILTVIVILHPATGQSQSNRGGYGYGYGYGYGMGPGMMGGSNWVNITSKLPAPKNSEWVQKLREILTLEKESLGQYQADHEKFNTYMPYMMIIPQEENHIDWIMQLFDAYGMTANGKTPPVVDNKTLTEAYELSIKLERDLLPRYEWLVKNAEDRDSAGALNTILIQSRWHLVMFEHALRMGPRYGYGMGPGMMGGYGMGPGMMGGEYSYGRSRGYGQRNLPNVKPMDAKEAEAMVKDYLKSSRNPNLKLGKIRDAGSDFEAEIRTRSGALVDRVLIEKTTGYVRSAY